MDIKIETERLSIRRMTVTDEEFIFRLVNTDGWLRFIGDRNVRNASDAGVYIRKILANPNYHYNVISLKESMTPIGIVTFLKRDTEEFPDFGFALLPEYHAQGFAYEASTAYLNEIKAQTTQPEIIAITQADNFRSIALLEKLGFRAIAPKEDMESTKRFRLQ